MFWSQAFTVIYQHHFAYHWVPLAVQAAQVLVNKLIYYYDVNQIVYLDKVKGDHDEIYKLENDMI